MGRALEQQLPAGCELFQRSQHVYEERGVVGAARRHQLGVDLARFRVVPCKLSWLDLHEHGLNGHRRQREQRLSVALCRGGEERLLGQRRASIAGVDSEAGASMRLW